MIDAIFLNKERRSRVTRPLSLKISCLVLLFLPFLIVLSVAINNRIYWKEFIYFASIFNHLEILLIMSPIPIAFGLFLIQKWAWWALLFYCVSLNSYNGFTFFTNSDFIHGASLVQSFVGLLLVMVFLKKDISAPYFKLYPRGWRGEKRIPLKIPIIVSRMIFETKDISDKGLYIETSENLGNLNSEVTIEFPSKRDKVFTAGIVRQDPNGIGLAFRNSSQADLRVLDSILGEKNES